MDACTVLGQPCRGSGGLNGKTSRSSVDSYGAALYSYSMMNAGRGHCRSERVCMSYCRVLDARGLGFESCIQSSLRACLSCQVARACTLCECECGRGCAAIPVRNTRPTWYMYEQRLHPPVRARQQNLGGSLSLSLSLSWVRVRPGLRICSRSRASFVANETHLSLRRGRLQAFNSIL